MMISDYSTNTTLSLTDEIDIQLLFAQGTFSGLGKILISGTPVRSGQLPLSPVIQSMDGYGYIPGRCVSCQQEGNVLSITSEIIGYPVKNTDLADHGCAPYISLANWGQPVVDQLTLHVESREQVIRGERYVGLRYHYEFKSDVREIHQILDRQTWEIGGSCEGNECYIQTLSSPPENQMTVAGRFCSFSGMERTKEYAGSILGGSVGNFSSLDDPDYDVWYQLVPRFGDTQCFDFITSKQGSLFGYFESMADVNSLTYKERYEHELRTYDMHIFPLSKEAKSTAKIILFCKDEAPREPIDWRNRWTGCFDFCLTHYREPTQLKPAPTIPFLFNHQWGENSYARHITETLPLAKKLGYPAINIDTCLESALTQSEKPKYDLLGRERNQCCVWDWKVPEAWGGVSALKKLCDEAHAMDIEVYCWFNSNTTPGSPIHTNHPEWCIKRPARKYFYGAGFEGHLIYLDMNCEGLRKYIIDSMREIREATGLDGIWHDSFCCGMRAINYDDPLLRGQMEGTTKLIEELQALGFKYYTEGGMGPLGPDVTAANPANDFAKTTQIPAVYYDVSVVPREDLLLFSEGGLCPDDFFRWAAHGSPLSLGTGSWWGFREYDRYDEIMNDISFPEAIAETNQAYMALHNRMETRTIHPGGVMWASSKCNAQLFWATEETAVVLPQVSRVKEWGQVGTEQEVTEFNPKKNTIYEIEVLS